MEIPASDIPSHEWYYPDYPWEQEDGITPVFSEANLYMRMPKDDARLILRIAREYVALVEELGKERVEEILKRRMPR